jgi:hypothetical protein
MGETERLEEQVQRLPPQELAKFRTWFVEFDAQVWDDKIEADLRSGKLARLLAEARDEHASGESREL